MSHTNEAGGADPRTTSPGGSGDHRISQGPNYSRLKHSRLLTVGWSSFAHSVAMAFRMRPRFPVGPWISECFPFSEAGLSVLARVADIGGPTYGRHGVRWLLGAGRPCCQTGDRFTPKSAAFCGLNTERATFLSSGHTESSFSSFNQHNAPLRDSSLHSSEGHILTGKRRVSVSLK